MTRRTRIALLLACSSVAAYGCAGRRSLPPQPLAPPLPVEIRVGFPTAAGVVIEPIALEEYVAGVVSAELGNSRLDRSAADRLADVQALVARTYALANQGRHRAQGYDLCATTHCQLFRRTRGEPGALARAAAGRTAGRYVAYHGTPIQAVYHASCGGHTSDGDLIWLGRRIPYLTGVADAPCAAEGSTWRWETSAEALRTALNADSRTRVAGQLSQIDVLARDGAGRAVRVVLMGERAPIVTGEELRATIVRAFGPVSVRSTLFEVRIVNGAVIFEGRGIGHGVGLCQRGARARAAAGSSAEHIVLHYYPGTRIAEIRQLERAASFR